jgi:hypothetical protein
MRGPLPIVVFCLLLSSTGCGGGESDSPANDTAVTEEPGTRLASSPNGAPTVEQAYQGRVDEAWRKALAGENPASTCAGVKGRAVRATPGSADRALAACNVDIPTRYFLTLVGQVEDGEITCRELMVQVTTRLSSMTVSVEALGDLARESPGADTTGAAGAAAAVLTGEAAAGGGGGDPRQAVKDRLRSRVTEVCPGEAGLILR